MKKLILISLVLLGCQKKAKQPEQQTTTQSPGKVHCWYQMGFTGSYVFYKCTSTPEEYQQTSTYGATNQMNLMVQEKNNCNECQ